MECPYPIGLWNYFFSLFDIYLDLFAFLYALFLQASKSRWSYQSFNLSIAAIISICNIVWYARNMMVHANFFISLEKARLFIFGAIKGVNSL